MGIEDIDFLRAVADTLLPGGAIGHGVVLPAASEVDTHVELEKWLTVELSLANALDLIAASAGEKEAFVHADNDVRVSIIAKAQMENPAALATLISRSLCHYYECPRIIEAFGWPSRPPQPLGHELVAFNQDLLDPVRRRGSILR